MRRMLPAILFIIATAVAVAAQARTQPPILYKVSFPEPEHHWMQVEITFSSLDTKPLDVRMSRSSPGRYAVAEFAKNVFSIEAYNAQGQKIPYTRPEAD